MPVSPSNSLLHALSGLTQPAVPRTQGVAAPAGTAARQQPQTSLPQPSRPAPTQETLAAALPQPGQPVRRGMLVDIVA